VFPSPHYNLALDSNPLLQLITTTQYQRLASFMITKDRRMREIVSRHHGDIVKSGGYSCSDTSHSLYPSTIVVAIQAAFKEDPCVQVWGGSRLGRKCPPYVPAVPA